MERRRKDRILLAGARFHEGEKVFVRYHDELWYAGRVSASSGKHDDRIQILWAENDDAEPEVVRPHWTKPSHVIKASWMLRSGTLISIPNLEYENGEFNQDFFIKSPCPGSDGEKWRCTGKRGCEEIVEFKFMSMRPADIWRIIQRDFRAEKHRFRHLMPEVPMAKLLDGYYFVVSLPEGQYSHKDWKDKILMLGGKVHDSVEELYKVFIDPRKKVLLTLLACRTRKFYQALLANIPCVKLEWIDAIFTSKCFCKYDGYLTEAGTLRDYEKPYLQTNRPRYLLDNLEVGIYGADKFVKYWTSIIEIGRGRVTLLDDSFFDDLDPPFDVVLLDLDAPDPEFIDELCHVCNEKCIPVVNESFFYDSIIVGKKRPISLYVETSGSENSREIQMEPPVKKVK